MLESYLEIYMDSISLVERLHRLLLDIMKWELDAAGVTQVNNIQALLLYNIGDAELTAGELRSRGHYLGSNVSYNLKKLVQAGYIHHERSAADRRSVRVKLTSEGHRIRELVYAMYLRHCALLPEAGGLDDDKLRKLTGLMFDLESFWQDQIKLQIKKE
ncbi:MAG: hypothetical protein Dbin4_01800 [Alphaproteobacteria bacterium]|nr:hypothetical protein [Alphaproteobacteria bacterium]